MELTDTGAVSPSGHLPFRSANGSWVLPFDGRPTFLAVKPQDCQFAVGNRDQPDVQVGQAFCVVVATVKKNKKNKNSTNIFGVLPVSDNCFILDAGCVLPPQI